MGGGGPQMFGDVAHSMDPCGSLGKPEAQGVDKNVHTPAPLAPCEAQEGPALDLAET